MSDMLDQTQGPSADPSPAASQNAGIQSPFPLEAPVTVDAALRDTSPAETPAPSPAFSEEDAAPAYGEQDADDAYEDEDEDSYDEDDDSYDDEDDASYDDTDDAPEEAAARNAAFRDLRVRAQEADALREQLESLYADPLLQEAWSHGFRTVGEYAQAAQAYQDQQQAQYLQDGLDNGTLTADQVRQIVQQQVAPMEQDWQMQAAWQAYHAAITDVPQLAADPDLAALLQQTPAEHISTVARAVKSALAKAEQSGYDRAVRSRAATPHAAPPTGADGYAPPDIDAPDRVWSIGEALRTTSRRLTH